MSPSVEFANTKNLSISRSEQKHDWTSMKPPWPFVLFLLVAPQICGGLQTFAAATEPNLAPQIDSSGQFPGRIEQE